MDKTELMMAVLDRYDTRYRDSYAGWQSVRCPNDAAHTHGDKDPSARVNLTKGGFFCNGCGMAGDGYNLLMELEGVSFKEAAAQLGRIREEVEDDWII